MSDPLAQLPDDDASRAVRAYVRAQQTRDFSAAADFFAAEVLFNGLVLRASGRDKVAAEMQGFLQAALDVLDVEAAAQVDPGPPARYLVLNHFKLKPQAEGQPLCDHLTIVDGRIAHIDNVFDASRVPPMP